MPYQYDFYLRYVVAGQHAWWSHSTRITYTAKFDGIVKTAPVHLVKFGAEITFYNLPSDIVQFEPRMTYFGKPMVNEPQLDFSSAYTYAPRAGWFYVQDKMDVRVRGCFSTSASGLISSTRAHAVRRSKPPCRAIPSRSHPARG